MLAAGVFAAVSIVIAGVVMAILPSDYKLMMDGNFIAQAEKLLPDLEKLGFEESSARVQEFCLTNQADASFFGDSNFMQYEGSPRELAGQESHTLVQCAYGLTIEGREYSLYLKKYAEVTDKRWGYIKKMLPAFLSVVGVLSVLVGGAFAVLGQHLREATQRLRQAMQELKDTNILLEEDIRKERERERANRDFFAAASHELKTPITILKGELEGMIYQVGMYQDRDKYLRHALQMTDEMEELIREIMGVSRLEAQKLLGENQTVNMGELIEECCVNFRQIALGKRMVWEVPEKFPQVYISGNRKLWKKVFSNIIGNAVLHSPDGERVRICLQEKCLLVENSGVHIPEEHLGKLFEPFYRPDLSRSRETGGSGLGLYLVRQALEMYGCGYRIENTETGVCFTVNFLQKNTGASPELYESVVGLREEKVDYVRK